MMYRWTVFMLSFFLVVLLGMSFVAGAHSVENPSWSLRIPPQTCVVSTFNEFRTLEEEYQLLSKVYFIAGEYALPLQAGEYPISIFDRLEFGPNRKVGVPRGMGTLTVERAVDRVYYTIDQDMVLDDGEIHLSWEYLSVNLENDNPVTSEFVLGEPYLSESFYMIGETTYMMEDTTFGDQPIWLDYSSETYEGLPAWVMNVDLGDEHSIRLYYRYRQPFAGSGPANLVYAEIDIEEGRASQADYWKLVYSASHHNWTERFMVLFDQTLNDVYGVVVYGSDIFTQDPEKAFLLDAQRNPIRELKLSKATRTQIDEIPIPSAVDHWDCY